MNRRARLAASVTVVVNAVSRRLGLGGGSVIGGRAGLALDRGLLESLVAGRQVALVSGTNGKTTTTRLLSAALATTGPVATSGAGANLPAGLVAALAGSPTGTRAVLEVDEGFLPAVATAAAPVAVVLLNLSRDQLDRVGEVRMVAERWRRGVPALGPAAVVANADDPLVVWAAETAPRVIWVAAGQLWRADAAGCPACGGRIDFGAGPSTGAWRCTGCGRTRPAPDVDLQGTTMRTVDGRHLRIDLALPGRCNLANAAVAATAAGAMGLDEEIALGAMAEVTEVQGRFASLDAGGVRARLLLAKNPAGWAELLDLLGPGTGPVVVGINARIADGRDPSWLWDVEFERLAGRTVVATGERAADLDVRLRYAGVTHRLVVDQIDALAAAGDDSVDYVGNYTAFQQLRRRIGRADRRGRSSPTSMSTGRRAVDRPGLPVPVPVLAADEQAADEQVADERVPEERAAHERAAHERAAHERAPDKPRAGRSARARASALRVVVVHPDLLGTYGDGGNGRILAARAQWREMAVELVHAASDRPLPRSGDVYCLGGGEDGPQVYAAVLLRTGAVTAAVDRGAAVLAVCAGYQVVGASFPDAQGNRCPGVGLLEVTTFRGTGPRAVGELVAEVAPDHGLGTGRLTGFENHAAVTRLGPGVEPLGRVVRGVGNGDEGRTEGARSGRVVGTYMHGPALARNPALADMVLGLVVDGPLTPLDDEEEDELRRERLGAAADGRRGRGRGWHAGGWGRPPRLDGARNPAQPGVVPVSS